MLHNKAIACFVKVPGREMHMAAVEEFKAGGYRFIPGGFQFSGGVAAAAGHEIKRYRFRAPVRLMEGFARIEAVIKAAGRPLTAFCACELRSPGQFTEQGFREFNQSYVITLGKWGIYDGKVNPVARSNVCPEIDPPAEPGFHAFSFTVPAAAGAAPSFVISGSAEARAIEASYRERIIRFGETSAGRPAGEGGFRAGGDHRGGSGCSASAGATPPRPSSIRSATPTRCSPTLSSDAVPPMPA